MFVPFSFFWLVFPFIKDVMLLYRKKKLKNKTKQTIFMTLCICLTHFPSYNTCAVLYEKKLNF